MIYTSSNTQKLYNYEPGKKQTICPECSENRRKKNVPCVTWFDDYSRGYCHHCETTFFPHVEGEKKVYIAPEWKNITKLSDKAVKYFEGRGISQKSLNTMRVYSDSEWMPQFQKEVEVICFPYFRGGKLVNIKYRGAKKSFKLVLNAELIFWNIDNAANDVTIVEGEMDLLAFIESGVTNVVSVPNGANKNLEYIDSATELFEKFSRINLCVDNDAKGLELRDELARRFGFDKCFIVNLRGCKDANEYLQKHGGFDLKSELSKATPYPIKGIVKVNDIYSDIKSLFETGMIPGLKIQSSLDEFITWETGRLCVVTGIPGHGKSELVDFIITKLNIMHGWKVALFSPENYPLKFHYAKIYEKLIGRPFNTQRSTESDFNLAYEYIRDNFFYIMDEDDFTLEMILKAGKQLVKSRGVKVVVIDPYNKIDYQADKGETETRYINRLLDSLVRFAKFQDVLVILVAHPTKLLKNKDGDYPVPTLYDISGSANFNNKADYGISIYRYTDRNTGQYQNIVDAHIQKVKFKHLGKTGKAELMYNYNNGRFEGGGRTVDVWDNSNWLINNKQSVADEYEYIRTTNEVPF